MPKEHLGNYTELLCIEQTSHKISHIQSQVHHWFRPLIQGDPSAADSYDASALPISIDLSENAATFIPNELSLDRLNDV